MSSTERTRNFRGTFWEAGDEENRMNMKRGSLAQLNNPGFLGQCVALAPKEHEAHAALESALREIRLEAQPFGPAEAGRNI